MDATMNAPLLARWLSLRGLQFVAGLLLLFGIEGMITSEGLHAPNPIVWLGLLAVALMCLLAWRVEGRKLAGLWISAAAVALPLLLQALARLPLAACPPDHPPLTEVYTCVAPGALPLALVCGLVLVGAVFAALIEWRSAPRAST
jgi:hypothetical protein